MPRLALLVIGVLAFTAAPARAQDAGKIPPAKGPSEVGEPKWTRGVQMPDGRVFVTDGAIMVDAAVARPAVMPASVLPVANGAIMEKQMTAPATDEIALSSLRPGTQKNTFLGPRGIALNGNHVALLRRVAPASVLRFRAAHEGITVVSAGKIIGLMMPVAQPK